MRWRLIERSEEPVDIGDLGQRSVSGQVPMFQPSAVGCGETIELRDGGWIRYWEHFLLEPEADRLFEALRRDVPWQQFRNRLWTFPRLTAFVADAGVVYRYSGVQHAGDGWAPGLLDVRRRAEQVTATTFNGVLLNLYRDGNDSMGPHADAELELGLNPLVASVSLGAVRPFVLRHKASKEKRALDLAHGSLLLMGGTLQHHWVHELPKTKQPIGERINLTFRRFIVL
jgi:alkylated DNA repair dioxygenase AlkB